MRIRIRRPSLASGRKWKYARLRRTGGPPRPLEESLPSIRIAVYRKGESSPLVEDVSGQDIPELLGRAGLRVYTLARAEGGGLSHSAIREIVENLIHAGCAGAVVSILNGGRVVIVSDQGTGIPDKERAVRPGFTTATPSMRRYIRGVGSGFLVASESLVPLRGSLRIEDNLGRGAVVALEQGSETTVEPRGTAQPASPGDAGPPRIDLPVRLRRALLVLAESQHGGPTLLARELGISLATAHRELGRLEALGLIQYVGKGKRAVTPEGIELVRSFFGE